MAANDLNYYRGTWSLPVAQGMTADTLGGRTGGFRQREIVTHNNHQWIYVGAADDQLDEPGAAGNDTWRDLGSIVDESATITEQLDTLPIEQAHDYTTTGSLQWTLVADSSLDFLSNGVFQTEVLNADVTNTPAIGTNLYGFLAEPASLTGITENPDIVLRLSRIVPDVISPASTYYFNVVSGIQNITTASPTSSVVELTAAQTAMLNRLYVRSAAADANVEEVLTRNPDGTFDFQIPTNTQLTEAPFDGITIENNQISVDHSVVATHFNAQRTYVAGNSVFFDIGPTTSGRRIRSYWTTNAPITAGQVPVFTRDTVGAGTYEQNDYIVDTVGGNRGLYLRTSPTGTANRPSDIITGWTLQTPTAGNWRELALDLAADSIGDLGDVDTITTAPTNGQVLKWNATDSEWQPADDNTGGGGGGASTVPAFAQRTDYVDREIVSQGTSLYIVNNVAQANAAADPANANSGFLLVGEFDSTHVISYDDQEIIPRGSFTLREGDTLFIQPATNFIGNVEVYQIRTNDLVIVGGTGGTFGISGGTSVANNADDALNQFRVLLTDRAVRTDNLELLRETDFGAGIARSGDHLVVDIDTSTLDFNGGAIEVKEDGITTDRIADLNVTHSKLADNAISNRNVGDRAIHSDNIDYHTIIRSNLSFDLQAAIDANSGITVSETTGEIETGVIIRPSNIEGRDDWEMHVLPNGDRTISFTEVNAPTINVGDHFSLTAGSAAPPTGTVQTNAVLRIPPVEIVETHTLTANVGQAGLGSFAFSAIQVNGVTATTSNSITLRQGTYFRVANAIVALDSDTTFDSATMTVAGRLVNGATFPVGNNNALTPISETIDVTRVELDLIEGSMVGTVDLFTYLDALTPAATVGGDGVFTFSPNSSIYQRRTIVHTAHGDRVGNVAGANENDFVSNQAEFDVTEIRIGSGNSRNTAGVFTPLADVDYTDVAVSWSSVAANGEIWLVWRGNQENIEGIINAMAAIMNVSSNTDTGIYFNGDPAGIIIPSLAPNNIPYIRVIRNPTAYHANTANAISRALRISLRENGQRIANQLVTNNETLAPTHISSLFANGTFQLAHTAEVPALVRFQGVDASSVAVGSLQVTRFGTQIQQDDDAIAVQTLYYSHNTNGAFPNPMTPDPGSRIRINEIPYSAGTTMSFAPEAGNTLNLIATIRGPSAQRVADDLDRTFTSAFTSRIGALWFADHGDAFSEVNTRVGIDFTDTQARHFLEAGRTRRYSAPVAVPLAAAENMTETGNAYSANTMISWRRDGDNFIVTLTGDDRERVGRSLRNFLSERTADRSTLYFRSDGSTADPANDAAARALPYLAINIPPIPGYSGGEGRITAIENQRARFPAPDSQYDQAGATLLSLYGLIDQDTETLRLGNGKTITALFADGANNINISASDGIGNVIAGSVIPGTNVGMNNNTTTVPNGGMFYKTLTSPTTTWRMNNGAQPAVFTANLLGSDIGQTGTGALSVLTLAFLLGSVQSLITGAPTASLTNPTGAIFVDNAYTDAAGGRARGRLDAEGLFDLLNIERPANPDTGMHDPLGLTDRDGNRVRFRTVGGTAGATAGGDGLLVTGIGRRDATVGGNSDHGLVQFSNPGGTTAVFAVPPAVGTEVQRQLTPAVGTGTAVDQVLNGAGGYVFDSTTGDNGSWTAVPTVNPSVT